MVRREARIKRKLKTKKVRRQQSGASTGNEEKGRVWEWKECRGRGRSGERRRRVQEADLKGKKLQDRLYQSAEKRWEGEERQEWMRQDREEGRRRGERRLASSEGPNRYHQEVMKKKEEKWSDGEKEESDRWTETAVKVRARDKELHGFKKFWKRKMKISVRARWEGRWEMMRYRVQERRPREGEADAEK